MINFGLSRKDVTSSAIFDGFRHIASRDVQCGYFGGTTTMMYRTGASA